MIDIAVFEKVEFFVGKSRGKASGVVLLELDRRVENGSKIY